VGTHVPTGYKNDDTAFPVGRREMHPLGTFSPAKSVPKELFFKANLYPPEVFVSSSRITKSQTQTTNTSGPSLGNEVVTSIDNLAELDVITDIHTSSWKMCIRYLFLVAVALPFLVRCMNSSQIACTTQRCSRIPTVHFDHRIDEIPHKNATNSQYRTWPNTL